MKSKKELIEKWESAIESAGFYGKGKEKELIGYMKEFIADLNQLDEPEATLDRAFEKVAESYPMTKEEICRHLERLAAYGGKVTYGVLDESEVLSQELPAIPQFVADYIEEYKGWNDDKELYDEDNAVDLFGAMDLDNAGMSDKVHDYLVDNQETFARAWLDGYTVEEEQKYHALIKGHENIVSDDKYWNYCITDESLDIGGNKVHADVLDKYVLIATKDEWENLGISDDNADFVKVEEMKE